MGGAIAFLAAPLARAQLYTQSQALFGDPNPSEYFGSYVAASGDTLAVSTSSNKRIYVFVHTPGGWVLQQKISANYSNQSFGRVALDGDTLVAGTEIYARANGAWTLQYSVPIGVDTRPAVQGDTVAMGVPRNSNGDANGAVYVFTRSGTTWTQRAVLSPDTPGQVQFGVDVKIDHGTIVAATQNGNISGGPTYGAYVFTGSGATWTQQARLVSPSDGWWMSIAIDGDRIAVSDPLNNRIYLWARSGTNWSLTTTIPLPGTGNYFGDQLALSGDFIAASAGGPSYVLSKTDSGWVVGQFFPDGGFFGTLDLTNHGKTFVVADPYNGTQSSNGGIVNVSWTPPPPAPGSGWRDFDVGAVGVPGGSDDNGGSVTVRGSGADIWDRGDQFHFRTESLTGDGAIVARVNSAGSGNPWAKIGLMFREDTAPASKTVMALVTPGSHLGMQARESTSDITWFQDSGWADAPIWLMLVRSGNQFASYRSSDGDHWTQMAGFAATMPATIHAGLAVSSHDNSALITGAFSDVEIVPTPPPGPLSPPTNLTGSLFNGTSVRLQWTDNSADESNFNIERATGAGSNAFVVIKSVDANVTQFTDTGLQDNTTYNYRIRAVRYSDPPSEPSNTFMITSTTRPPDALDGQDLGTVEVPGAFTNAGGVVTIDASGSDIWGTEDSGYFAYRVINGDFDIRAQVTSLTNTNPWAKAGVMARERLDDWAQNVFTLLTADNVAGMQVRRDWHGSTTFTSGPWVNAPYWVRLVRNGSTFTSYLSPDGVEWQTVGTTSITLPPPMYVGVAVTSHAPTTRTRATVSSLQVNVGPP